MTHKNEGRYKLIVLWYQELLGDKRAVPGKNFAHGSHNHRISYAIGFLKFSGELQRLSVCSHWMDF
jgi:hypothetical protein